jgi:hypothetical protein
LFKAGYVHFGLFQVSGWLPPESSAQQVGGCQLSHTRWIRILGNRTI